MRAFHTAARARWWYARAVVDRALGGAIVADDLTGAMDSGVQMRGAVPVVVEVNPDKGASAVPAATTLVINTQTRGLAAPAAAARVRAACARLREEGRTAWFKKLDSTLRGNVGAELAALQEALAPCTILCTPALPAQGRTVVAGELLVHGQPVMLTPYRDEIVPAAGSAVLDVVRRQWPTCRAVGLAAPAVAAGLADAVRAGADLIVADAASDAHLRQLAVAGRRLPRSGRRLLWAGSAALLRVLAPAATAAAAQHGGGVGAGGSREWSAAAPLLLVAGSRRTLAQEQLGVALSAARPPLGVCLQAPAAGGGGPLWHLSGGGGRGVTERAAAVARAARTLAAGGDLFVWSAPPARAAERSSEAVSLALAEFTREVLARSTGRPRSLLLVGGDTAYACLRRLGIGAVALAGEAEPYVPWGRVVAGPWAGTAVISKAGGFGDPGTLQRIRSRLLSPAAQSRGSLPAGSPGAPLPGCSPGSP